MNNKKGYGLWVPLRLFKLWQLAVRWHGKSQEGRNWGAQWVNCSYLTFGTPIWWKSEIMGKQIWHALLCSPRNDLCHLELYQMGPWIAARQVYFSYLWKVLAVTKLIFLASPCDRDYINYVFASLTLSRLPPSALTENGAVAVGFQADNSASLREGGELPGDLNTCSAYQGCINPW